MKIELKNVKINESFSEETTCFMADVFINGKKVAHAKNNGQGGDTDYYHYEGQREVLIQAEKFCSELPKQEIVYGDTTHRFKQTLETVIDDLLFAKGKEKENKKIEKLCDRNIVWGKANGIDYSYVGFNGNHKIVDMQKSISGQKALEKLIERVKKELREGDIIFNKNLVV